MFRFIKNTAFFAAFFAFFGLCAQSPVELKKRGEQFLEAGRWREALLDFEKFQEQKPGDLDVLASLGIAAYRAHEAEKARKFLAYIIDQKGEDAPKAVLYNMARLLHAGGEWKKAIQLYKLFLKKAPGDDPLRANAVDNIKRCVTGLSLLSVVSDALVDNAGEGVNTFGDEFGPVPSPKNQQRFYYSAAREGCIGGLRNERGLENPTQGRATSDMFVAELSGGIWADAGDLGSLLCTPRHEQILDFSPDGQTLYFFRGFSLFSGDILTDTSSAEDEKKIDPTHIFSPMRPEIGDCAPFFWNDTTLLFASRRAGGFGGLDIWISFFSIENRAWSPPSNLGPIVNTGYDETTPFLARDGRTLFFSSNSLRSMGGLDVFRSRFDPKKLFWRLPENLGSPVNSGHDDAFFRITKDGKEGLLASDRMESVGERDIFVIHFKKEQTEQTIGSVGDLFADLLKNGQKTNEKADPAAPREAVIPPIYYENEKDILGQLNQKRIDDFLKTIEGETGGRIVVTAHTDDQDPAKFALFYGIRRAETVGRFLVEKGVAPERILLRSCGLQYPLARSVVGSEESVASRRLNRRIEMTVAAKEKIALTTRVERPIIAEVMASEGAEFFETTTQGLSYRVQVATTRQLLAADELMMFTDLMIEQQVGLSDLAYLAGLYKTFNSAEELRKELAGQGFEKAVVVPMVNGLRITKDEAKSRIEEFPDLAFWLKK